MIGTSLVVAILGVVSTWLAARRLEARAGHAPDVGWLLGLMGLLPAWLIPFVGLLGRLDAKPMPAFVALWWILSGAAALGGVILTHSRLRARVATGQPASSATFQRLGVCALLPAWCLALLGVVLTTPGVR
jgi:hypothetical protein